MEKIKVSRFDQIIEKHEGPEKWVSALDYLESEIMFVNGYYVLLPVDKDHHPNIKILRCIVSDDSLTLTIFLKDTTHGNDWIDTGFVAILDKIPESELYLTIFYHEWFIIEPAG